MHPFVRKVKQYIDQHRLIEEKERLLIACSGGTDSVAVVLAMRELAVFYSCELGIVHTDHQLRGKESAEDLEFVKELANRLKLPFYSAALEVMSRVEQEGGNVQVICRQERYSFFDEVMETYNYNKLLLGHHADDQIENVLMSLIRGTISSTITGIPKKRPFSSGQIIRPFLGVTKQEIATYLKDQQQLHRHDPSNDKHTYTRNRIRHRLVPLLKEENPNISDRIMHFVEKQLQDEKYLQEIAAKKYEQLVTVNEEGALVIDSLSFSTVPIALQRRVILLLLEYLYKNSDILLNDRLIESILAACNNHEGNEVLHLPNAFHLTRHYNHIQFSAHKTAPVIRGEFVLSEDCWINCGAGFSIYLTRNLTDDLSQEKWFVQLENHHFPLSIRQKVQGDRIRIKGMSSSKKVSRLFIDEKVLPEDRMSWPLLVQANNDIIAVIGLRYGELFSKQHSSQNYVMFVKRDK
ncbi:tRNA lysidine(34) synthetase TilS [Psychrobacillus sp. FSL W7-1457]|uniref:tRNA lysidine(34) synthetase TilS n=1 Tax=unclassified Psychrobacillus TaxID=2636677 RepID=UPI0030F5D293